MESLLVALNAVIPFLCYISFGYIVRMKKIVSESFLQQLNQMVFRLFYPCMTFYNIYKADAESLPRPVLLIFVGASILILEAILILVVPRFVLENPKRGVVIQGIFRSNFVLFGLPLTISVFGDSAASVAAMVVTVVVTIYNTTSVVILEMFNTNGKINVKNIAFNVIKNPLLQGAVIGLVFFLLGIHVPESIVTPIAAFSDATSPLALFVLGIVLGISWFIRLLGYLLRRFHDLTIAVLIGFMLGSLRKVWPWKLGDSIENENILPSAFDNTFFLALLLGAAGFALVLLIERFAGRKEEAASTAGMPSE